MKYSDLKILARAYVPQATIDQISEATLELILRQGALDVAMRTRCLKANQKFDSEASIGSYTLGSKVTRFLNIDKSGLFWKNGSTYVDVKPKTTKWLDENIPTWRNGAAGNPEYYAMDSGELIVYPKPASTVVEAFWLYFFQQPPTPATDDYYPFGGATEIPRLAPLSECILYYWKWKALGILGKPAEMDAFKPHYLVEIEDKMKHLNTRLDISASNETRLGGGLVG